MKLKYNILFPAGLIAVSVLYFTGCAKETEVIDESTFGYDYFPLSTGQVRVYSSDSIIYDNNGTKIDTFRSFIKEEIAEVFENENNTISYRVNRFFRQDTSRAWTRMNTWTASREKNRAIRTEENLKFVKLVFPIKKGQRWDGNVFLDENIKIDVAGEKIEAYKNWKYRIEETNLNYDFNGTAITAIKVNLVDDSSIIDRRKVIEYYGKNVGLLKKEMTILDSDGSRPNDPWELKAQRGFIHVLTLIDIK